MFKKVPVFPAGSMIVREKRLLLGSGPPEVSIAMVKHEKGFSKETGDWEFIVLNGNNLKLESRQTKGSCAECHARVKESDWVFREYLKNK